MASSPLLRSAGGVLRRSIHGAREQSSLFFFPTATDLAGRRQSVYKQAAFPSSSFARPSLAVADHPRRLFSSSGCSGRTEPAEVIILFLPPPLPLGSRYICEISYYSLAVFFFFFLHWP
ncbi:hypothetical protein OsJ_29270 [Oryza sativa Japonica Group]|uniref:Uncharacterized protein n=1 Tax=Oryza sativa subsp. japonica TaxID=39947 RepID=B9G3F9_ORYSJ|nr:hypothetical protein OsJ_29270 [Oryza sativa Japonica Group]BAD28585.1 hypothetical protein [Oryza sativa Japonica Group]BAD28788.1 hypothetical protein [Oryza sativa Japonica Group]